MNDLKDIICGLDRSIPRYTSYPTAPHFQKRHNLNPCEAPHPEFLYKDPISLYVHIPFCRKLCWYCGCNTKVVNRAEPIKRYLKALTKEIEQVAKTSQKSISVSHIHFGGGSPGILEPDDFRCLMDTLQKNFDVKQGCEVAIELDPREVDKERTSAYAEYGINRVSLGCQSFELKVLCSVNRQQKFSMSQNAVSMLRNAGIEKINLDLMYGLPHQTVAGIERSLWRAMRLKPDRISFFGYAHVPWAKKHMSLLPQEYIPDTYQRYDQFSAGYKALKASGFLPVGIDHFVLPGDNMGIALKNKKLRRNFQGYTDDSAKVLVGLGASSISETPNAYFQNEPETAKYIDRVNSGLSARVKSLSLTQDDRIRKQVISDIMCYGDVNLSAIQRAYSLDDLYFEGDILRLTSLVETGLVKTDNKSHIRVSQDERLAWRMVAAAFDAYLDRANATMKHAKAV